MRCLWSRWTPRQVAGPRTSPGPMALAMACLCVAFLACGGGALTHGAPSTATPSPAPGSTPASTGEQSCAIILVSLPSLPLLSSVTPQLLQDTYFGTANSVSSYLREVSYGQTWATGQVFGPYVIDGDYFDQPLAIRDAAIRAACPHVDLTRYGRIVLVVPQASSGMDSGGLGSIGSETIPLYPSGSVVASTTWLGDASAGSTSELLASACHEMGHNLGLQHARAADFGEDAMGPTGQAPMPWDQLHDYGDSFSNMARGIGHWAAPQKAALGWLKDGVDVQTVQTAGTYVLQPYEQAGTGLKAIRVQRGTGSSDWLWVEFRQAAAGVYDAGLPPKAFTGALVHGEDSALEGLAAHSYLLRFNPDDVRGILFGNAPLAAGSSWADPYSNLTLAVGSDLSRGLRVTVSYGPASAITVTPAATPILPAGGSATLTVAAPAGTAWTAVASASWMVVTSGASGTGDGSVGVTVAPAVETTPRWGRIIVGQTAAVVTQAGLAGNTTLTPASAAYPATGGTGTIAVAANADDYAWSYSYTDTWIQSVFFSKLASTGSGTLRYIVAQNPGTAARTGTITVDGHTFTITQDAGGPGVSRMDWELLTVTDSPISRLSMDMAGAMSSGESILYGGGSDGTVFSDTWSWNGTAWLKRSPAHNPGAISDHAMAYDSAHGRIVLFGGFTATAALSGQTWVWNGADWSQMSPQASPPARAEHGMAYNASTGKTVLFGGCSDTTNAASDTWEWDGANWSEKTSTVVPAGRDDPAMAYDAAHGQIVMFGGCRDLYSGLQPKFFNDTWVWDGSQWQQKVTAAAPTPRCSARMAYDPALGQIVLVGGYGAKDVGSIPPFSYVFDYREETWTWDGTTWTQQFPNQSPPFSYTYGMLYDAVHQAFYVHLGDDLHCADRGPKTYVLTPGPAAMIQGPVQPEPSHLVQP